MDSMERRCPKLTAKLAAGPVDAETLRGLLDSQRMVKLFEEPWHGTQQTRGQSQMDVEERVFPRLICHCFAGILPESACPRPGQLPQGLGASRPFGTLRLREMAQAHFEEVVVKAIDAHWFDEASWTLAESQELFHFLAALEYPLGLDSCTTLEVLRACSGKGGIVAVENLVLGGTWHPNGWNGIEGCRFIPEPSLSLEDLQSMAVDSDRARACELWEQMMA
eukprot:s23_g2.t2